MALGDTDELNATVGLALEWCGDEHSELRASLPEIQSRLLDIGSAVATPVSSAAEHKMSRVNFDEAHVSQLEAWIDAMDEELPALRNFILPVRTAMCLQV